MQYWIALLFFGLSCFCAESKPLHVKEAGKLRELLLDWSAEDLKDLELSGVLNYEDLAYINQGKGKISFVVRLDLSKIKVEPSDHYYVSTSVGGSSEIGLSSYTAEFYYSEECHTDTVSSPNGLGGGNVVYKIYSNQLDGLFIKNKTVKQVVLPETLTSVGSYMFYSSAVETVALPAGIKSVGPQSFALTPFLHTVNLPDGVEKMGEEAFYKSAISELQLPVSCREIGGKAFAEYPTTSKRRKMDLSHVEIAQDKAFQLSGIEGDLRLDAIRYLGVNCFAGCNLSSVFLGDHLLHIPPGAFSSDRCAQFRLPSKLKTIGSYALPKSVDVIEQIPLTLEYVGRNAIPRSWYKNHLQAEDGIYYLGHVAYAFSSEMLSKQLDVLRFRNGTVAVSPNLNSRESENFLQHIRRVEFPSSVKNIGGYSDDDKLFSECDALESALIPEGVEVIGANSFFRCSNLKQVDLPQSLRYIGEYAFQGTGLDKLRLGPSIEMVGEKAFADCNRLVQLELYSHHAQVFISTSSDKEAYNRQLGQWYITDSYHDKEIFTPGIIESIVVGAQVQFIPRYLSYNNSNLFRVTFEEDGTDVPLEIGDYAFTNCRNMRLVEIPQRTRKIGESAFSGNQMPQSFSTRKIESLGRNAFSMVTGLEVLHLDSPLQFCDEFVFSEIGSLKEVHLNANIHFPQTGSSFFKKSKKHIERVVIGSEVENIPAFLFADCDNLKDLSFEKRDSSRRLNFSSFCFSKAISLTTLRIPDVPVIVEDMAFEGSGLKTFRLSNRTEEIKRYALGSTKLSSLDIPLSVRSIDLVGMSNIDTLYFHHSEPPLTRTSSFYNQVIYVPAGSEAAYRKYEEYNTVNKFIPYGIERFSFDRSEVEITPNNSLVLKVNVEPAEYRSLDRVWESSNVDVATVNEEGDIQIVGCGETTIRSRFAYVDHFVAECHLRVTATDTAIDEVVVTDTQQQTIYNLQGVLMRAKLKDLPNGIYIVNGKKVIKY